MSKKTSRPLNNFELVEHFLENALDFDLSNSKNYEIVPKIVSTELNIENFDETLISLNSKSYRTLEYRKDNVRKKLQNQIVLELLEMKRLQSDEDIKLENGGAFPNTEINTDLNAYIVIGLPASGKSSIAEKVADECGAFILDSDYAKRKLPEFNKLPFGATLVHEESDRIIFGEEKNNDLKSLFDYCREVGANIVIPKIGSNYSGIINLIVNVLKKNNYKVHLTLVDLDRIKATQRALKRFEKTDRYVPLGLIFDTYANNPSNTFYKLITYNNNLLESYGIINADVKENDEYKRGLINGASNPANLYRKK